ncbi:MAG: NADH:ubiquinone oxidoreductase [Deltaproteobacteria bacterium]|nr:NADH:ubiquinone oxidoreductase [Deltaproteobacteria bacterium]
MKIGQKPKAAFFSFTSCEGCQLQVLSLADELVNILNLVEIINFREAIDEKRDDYDIAFIEGSISRTHEIDDVKKIREKARIVVALGACSSIGGLNCLKNRFSMDDVKRIVYGERSKYYNYFDTIPARPIDAVIPVDYYIYGCPITGTEFLNVLKALLIGKKPDIPNHPVCVDCKMAENICVFEKGETCVGPVTRAGCDAVCITYGSVCWGCRGLVDNPNITAHKETLKRHGLTAHDILGSFNLYDSWHIRGDK